jgi:hypothetical protein
MQEHLLESTARNATLQLNAGLLGSGVLDNEHGFKGMRTQAVVQFCKEAYRAQSLEKSMDCTDYCRTPPP